MPWLRKVDNRTDLWIRAGRPVPDLEYTVRAPPPPHCAGRISMPGMDGTAQFGRTRSIGSRAGCILGDVT